MSILGSGYFARNWRHFIQLEKDHIIGIAVIMLSPTYIDKSYAGLLLSDSVKVWKPPRIKHNFTGQIIFPCHIRLVTIRLSCHPSPPCSWEACDRGRGRGDTGVWQYYCPYTRFKCKLSDNLLFYVYGHNLLWGGKEGAWSGPKFECFVGKANLHLSTVQI